MPGETAVETPQPPQSEVVEKKDIVEAEAKEAEASEKKDEEKKEKESADKAKADKAKKVKPAPPPPVHKKDFEKDVVYVYQFNRSPTVPSVSPYCLKLETWLKLQGIRYENVNHNAKLRSKRGLLPFVEYNGEEITDSELIIKTLGEKLGKNMDEGMEHDHVGVQHAMVSMVDNHLNWCLMQWFNRDMNETIKGFQMNLQHMTGSKLPNGILNFMMKHTYFRKNLKRLKAAGFASYTNEEIDAMGQEDLKVLSDLLGDKQFFFGDEPRSLDLKAFVQLAMMINVDENVNCPLRDYVQNECANLVGVYNRMKDQAWGDHWDEATGEKLDLNPHIPKPEPVKEEEKKEEEKKEDEKEKAEDKKEEKENKDEDKEKDNKEEK